MQLDVLVAAALTVLLLLTAGRALTNSVRQLGRVIREVSARRKMRNPTGSDPLAIFTDAELEALSVPAQNSRVPGTRVPDPRLEGLDISAQRAAIYANILRDRAAATSVILDLVVIAVSVLLGLAVPELLARIASGEIATGQIWGVGALMTAAGISTGFKTRMIPVWNAAAECYWTLALTGASEGHPSESDERVAAKPLATETGLRP